MRDPNIPIQVNYPPGYHREAPKRSAWVDAVLIVIATIIGSAAVAYIAHREALATRCDCYHDNEACDAVQRLPEPCNVAWRLHP